MRKKACESGGRRVIADGKFRLSGISGEVTGCEINKSVRPTSGIAGIARYLGTVIN